MWAATLHGHAVSKRSTASARPNAGSDDRDLLGHVEMAGAVVVYDDEPEIVIVTDGVEEAVGAGGDEVFVG